MNRNRNNERYHRITAAREKLIRAKPGRCYYNAFQVVQRLPEYFFADYVEGIAVLGSLHIEHAWVEKNGVIVDPSLPLDKVVYFAGLRFRGGLGLAKAMQIPKRETTRDDLPLFLRFGWGGIDSPEFRAARVAAYRHAGMEQFAKRYEDYQPYHAEEVLENSMAVVVK